ncbi:FUSC family protein [Gluconacetobacter entanii]|uniref:FUSC family protein n=1 Tax=Gluconacetobacter entanii TaxID=108528 RepID=A0ABT3K3C8_9PROT|nr:FUSC family protein [Gluconacetobacter entanii]MBE7620794.1 FUSC family protein [Komagataeibacter sp. FXV2]MCE2579433.1 FUSC family protein [Komagataeibacter sp. FNDCR1]MBY4640543.1 FUSC family protein [Gluconacetobacter entanii]MCW4580120.1 FUSC family protein [Gluconacetobacter entanii]MCW4583477.1 FUSC family protein [Gluconacetobacter entanii]
MRLIPPHGALSQPLLRLGTFVFPDWKTVRPTIAYSIRTLLAVGLALFLAFDLQLQTPMSSVTTVLIVANPVVGAMVSKSVWRIFGTIIGATSAITLMALFPQSPVLYFMGLSLIIGLACCVSTLLRFYKAYAAVLTGYTIILISVSAFSEPDHIFMAAMSRLSAVTVGILSTAFVFLLTNISHPEKVIRQIDQVLRNITSHFAQPTDASWNDATSMPDDAGQPLSFRAMSITSYDQRARLLSQANALVEAIEYAAADNYSVSLRARGLRGGVARLLGLLSAHHPIWQDEPPLTPQARAARHIRQEIMRYFATLPPEDLHLEARDNMRPIRRRIRAAMAELDELGEQTQDLPTIAFIDNERDVLAQLCAALDDFMGPQEHVRPIGLKLYFDWPAALRNGTRGACVTLLGCLFWYVCRWTHGANMLTYLIPASCLLATSPLASRASVMFASGTLAAIPAAFICQTFLLPRIDGYPLLWLSLSVCLLPGIWIQFHPRHAMRGFGYAVFFNAMVQIRNPITYSDLSLMNTWLAFALGVVSIALVFRVILPADHRLDSGRLVASIARATENLARRPLGQHIEWPVWENLQMQKILRIIQRFSLVSPPGRVYELTDAAFMAVSLGRVLVRLRTLVTSPAIHEDDRVRVMEALGAFRYLRSDPAQTVQTLRATALTLLSHLDRRGLPAHTPTRRIAACLEQASLLIGAIPGFFHRHGPLQMAADMPGADNRLTLPVSSTTGPFGMRTA